MDAESLPPARPSFPAPDVQSLSRDAALGSLSILADSHLFGVFEYDLVAHTLSFSADTFLRFGFAAGAARATFAEIWERILPGDRERVTRAAIEGIRTGQFSVVYRIQPPNQPQRWMQLQAYLQLSSEGAPLRWIGIVLDASSALAQETLEQEARDQIVTLVESVSESFIALDRDFRFTYVNQRVLDWLGKPRDRVIGESIWDVFPQAAGTAFRAEYQRVAAERIRRSFLVPYPTQAGDVWLEVHAFPTPEGIAALVRDVTELKAAQDALSESEERFRRAQQAANIGAFEWDLVTNRLTWAAKVPTFTDVADVDDFNSYLGYIDEADRPAMLATVQKILAGGAHAIEVRVHPPDGRLLWFYFRAEAVFDAGKPARMYGVVMDITERKHSEEALRTSEKLAAAGRLAATIAHEINNPLEAVTNLLYLATHTEGPVEETREYLVRAESELQRVAAIVRQTLGFYRGTTTPARLDLTTLARESLGLFEKRFAANAVRLLENFASPVYVLAVEGEIRQILTNLVANALDAVSEKGAIEVRLTTDDNRARLEVLDNGRGIPPAVKQRLFEPFFTTKERSGTGLGLWVSRELARKNGGNIESASPGEGQGSSFVLTLPLA
ncbi:MAG TPA: PAS domain-containing protein [Acidobacteriaceae bacterium]|jgi:PAS domain S-box-containing protein|nr:PAS domain-containing protein [Acidobacteriaceae bacterium]